MHFICALWSSSGGWAGCYAWLGAGNSKLMQFGSVTGPGTSPTSRMSLYRSTLSEYLQKTFKLVSQVVLKYKLQQLTCSSIANSEVNTNLKNNVCLCCFRVRRLCLSFQIYFLTTWWLSVLVLRNFLHGTHCLCLGGRQSSWLWFALSSFAILCQWDHLPQTGSVASMGRSGLPMG